MKNSISRVCAWLFVACVPSAMATSAGAAVSYSTSFEAPFTSGGLAGQQGWVTLAGGGSTAFQVANVAGRARTGTQYVTYSTASISGSNWQWFEPQAQTATDLADPASSIVRVSVWVNVFAASAATGVTRISYAGLDCYDITGVGRLGFIRIGSNGTIDLNNGTSAISGTMTGFALNQWNKVSIEFDYGADKLRWYLNDVQIVTSAVAGFDTFTATTFGDADIYGTRSTATGTTTGGHTLLWDDYSVQTIPAPGAIALLGVAGLVGARRRR
jgi:hypothetical protein